jgi:hypothetical protein
MPAHAPVVASILSEITNAITSVIGDYGLYAVFLLMLVDAVLPAASEVVMVYAGRSPPARQPDVVLSDDDRTALWRISRWRRRDHRGDRLGDRAKAGRRTSTPGAGSTGGEATAPVVRAGGLGCLPRAPHARHRSFVSIPAGVSRRSSAIPSRPRARRSGASRSRACLAGGQRFPSRGTGTTSWAR